MRGPGSIVGCLTHWTAWRRLLKDGEAQCQWARALKVLLGKNGVQSVGMRSEYLGQRQMEDAREL